MWSVCLENRDVLREVESVLERNLPKVTRIWEMTITRRFVYTISNID